MFFIQENIAFNLSVTQSIPVNNEWMKKTKLCTFTRKKILNKTYKETCLKNVWKHYVKPVGLYENTS